MSSDDIAIRVTNLSKRYEIYDTPRDRLKQFVLPRLRRLLGKQTKQFFREFWALKGVSFDVEKGKSVGIIGRNGSGKSTLLQMICGTLSPTIGSVRASGRVAALLELGSGFNPEFTGRENVYMNASVLGLSKQEIDVRFNDIAAFADIGDFIEQPVKTYSSGMTVRLAFAVIAHIDADILVIDEALAVGDTFFTQKCMRFLRKFMKSGTVLFVSHDTASVKNLCNYAIWLEHGNIVQQGSPKEVCEAYAEAAYGAQQRKSIEPKLVRSPESTISLDDQKPKLAHRPSRLNDIQVFSFDPDATSFGNGGAIISGVYLCGENEAPLSWIAGGETVTLRIEADVQSTLDSPILGFFVKDRLGQMLFGDNTYLTYKEEETTCSAGDVLQATFCFRMPLLPAGNYSITAAIANGTLEHHEQEHWIHDAIIFKSEFNRVSNGLIGIPMLKLELQISHAGNTI